MHLKPKIIAVSRYLFINWAIPLTAAVSLFIFIQPTLNTLAFNPQDLPLSFYLAAGGTVPVETKVIDNVQHIVYYPSRVECDEGQKFLFLIKPQCRRVPGEGIRVTNNQLPNTEPQNSGKTLAWMRQLRGGWQVVLHYLPTNTTIPLAISGNSVSPVLFNNLLAWESISGDTRSVLLYDGSSVQKLSRDTTSINPLISPEGNLIYSRRTSAGDTWEAVEYNLQDRTERVIATGDDAKYPRVANGQLAFGLTANDNRQPQVAGITSEDPLQTILIEPPPEAPQTTIQAIKQELTSTYAR